MLGSGVPRPVCRSVPLDNAAPPIPERPGTRLMVHRRMELMILKFGDDAGAAACTLCGESTRWAKGPRLASAETGSSVCRGCGKRHAAALVALLDLANVADKVGQQCRHLLTPPMESLLDLARAAENYSTSTPQRRVRAG